MRDMNAIKVQHVVAIFAEGVGIIVMPTLSKKPKTSHVGGGGAAAAFPTPPPVVNNRSQGSTAQTKKKNAGTGKGMHWTQKELDLMLDKVSQIKPTGKIVAFSFILIHEIFFQEVTCGNK
jgi:hypothetical protein